MSSTKLPFLDIMVTKKNTTITTDIYYKHTDTHQYLNFKLCHPPHTKRNIPYCLARRICTIVEDLKTRNQHLMELKEFQLKQKYVSLIENGIQWALKIPIQQLKTPQRREKQKQIIPFIVTHNPCHQNIFNITKANLPIFAQSKELRDIITDQIITLSKRQPKSLKKLLTKARFDLSNKDQSFTVSKCNDNQCGNNTVEAFLSQSEPDECLNARKYTSSMKIDI
ncbi:uncharacterized protein LOC115230173 isoform X1 [Octopus sinensis]|uniref:Uncharacterized protein LOC115230173 isoform X1 n=1 Tax=Octopus sinensis TaxID=2607531 RepID=A0A6P7U5L8_9MOLL|nr:uncharacterized protein LOC115230173 isoform X1 [Octopus sinensis]XP_029656256.1 uncharacterized protein LOC115230173 isoform X1 [Octopus sinensis]